jgi:circadian clock protein KaiC
MPCAVDRVDSSPFRLRRESRTADHDRTVREDPMPSSTPEPGDRCRSGIAGLDLIMAGGLPRRRLFLVRGRPGTGKTTLGLQFLLEGTARGESVLYITLSETREELELVARSHGWSLDGVPIIDLSAVEQQLRPEAQTTLLHPAEMELAQTSQVLQSVIEEQRPHRIVFDSLAELRLMAQSPLRYRRQILALKTFLASHRATVLMLDDHVDSSDHQLESLAHGVIDFEYVRPDFGGEQRRVSVVKMRGVRFVGGYHDYVIRTGGLEVFPRLIAAAHRRERVMGQQPSGVEGLDRLLHGGLDVGTSTLLMGPAGTGKSTIALQYAVQTAAGGQHAAILAFDESVSTLVTRAKGLGIPLEALTAAGTIQVQRIDPAELSPGQFVALVQSMVDAGVKTLVIDSLNGFLNAMPDERAVIIQLHELLSYLAHRSVTTIMTLAEHGLVGPLSAPVELSYLADTVLLLRFFEHAGAVRKGVSVIKRRAGSHESTIRELRLVSGKGIEVGEPLRSFRNVLGGIPQYIGSARDMLGSVDGGPS